MKRNPDYIISDVAGSHILVPVGKAAVNFNSILSLNDMGETVWNMLEEEISIDKIVNNILEEYDVREEKARADVSSFIEKLRENGAIAE